MILEIIGFIIFLIFSIAIFGYLYRDDWSDWQNCCALIILLFFLLTFIAGNNHLRRLYLLLSGIMVFILNRRASRLSVEEESANSQDTYNQNNYNIPQNEPEPNNRIEVEPKVEYKPKIEYESNRIEFDHDNKIEQDEEPVVKPVENIEIKKDKIDINIATQEELSNLNGLNLIQSKKIIQFRNNGKYIKSYDDLRVMLNLKDYQIKQIKDETFIDEKSIPVTRGRKVDL